MRRLRPILLCVLLLLSAAPVWAASLQVEPAKLALGQPALVRLCLEGTPAQVRAELNGRETALAKGTDGCWYGAVAPDLQDKTGAAVVRAKVDGKQVAAAKIKLYLRDRGARRIKVNSKYTRLSPETLKRYRREREQMLAVFGSFTPSPCGARPS